MQHLKILFLLIVVLVAITEAQKGGTKTRSRPTNVPPAPRQPPSPTKTRPAPQPRKPQPQPQRPVDEEGNAGNAIEEGNEGEGESGPEPPAVVPQTSFSCDDKPYQPGMYADEEVNCAVYHMCFDNRKESFLCGTGTMFNQEILSCDHPGKVNCANSAQYYEANTELGKPGKPEPSGDSGSKGGSVAPPPSRPQQPSRPRIQTPSKTSPPTKPAPQQPRQPTPAAKPAPQPFVDDETDEEPDTPPAPQPVPVPQPRKPSRPSKVSPPKPAPRPAPAKPQPAAPRKQPPTPRKPIVQSYDDNEEESNVRRAYRARY